jgi:hypothetical protein
VRAVIAPMRARRPIPAVMQVPGKISIRKRVPRVAEGPHPKCNEEYVAAGEQTNYPECYTQGFFHGSRRRSVCLANALVQLRAHLTMRASRAIQKCLSAATFVSWRCAKTNSMLRCVGHLQGVVAHVQLLKPREVRHRHCSKNGASDFPARR